MEKLVIDNRKFLEVSEKIYPNLSISSDYSVEGVERKGKIAKDILEAAGMGFVPGIIGFPIWDLFKDNDKVTKDDLNKLANDIQNRLVTVNTVLQDYNHKFLAAHETVKELNQNHISHMQETINKIIDVNDELDVVIKSQVNNIKALNEFKQKIEAVVHFDEVDDTWTNVITQSHKLQATEKKVSKLYWGFSIVAVLLCVEAILLFVKL